jgi:beta-ureidopropionase
VPRTVNIGLVQTAWTGSTESMIEAHEHYLRQAAEMGAQLVSFQELFNAPYFCQVQDDSFLDLAEPIPQGRTTSQFAALAAELETVLVLPLYERTDIEGVRYNSAAVIDADGTHLGTYRKHHIPHLPGFWEKYYFRPGNNGYGTFDTAVGKVGVYICYDRHFPEGWRALGLAGAEIVCNPTATSRSLSRHLWDIEARAAAVANGYFVAAINRVGNEPLGDNDFYGCSYVVDPTGAYVGEPASDGAEEVIVRTVDLDRIAEVRATWQWYRDRRPDSYAPLTEA